MNASRTPSGISSGAKTARLAASATITSAAPSAIAGRDADAQVGADEPPREMRDDQSDETDQPRECHGGGGEQRRGRQQDPLQAHDVDAERNRAPFADAHDVECRNRG